MLRSKQYAEAARLWAAGATGRQIAEAVGATPAEVWAAVKGDREAFPRRRHLVRVTDDEAAEIRGMREGGATWRAIAQRTGRDVRTVRRWAHAGGVA